MLYEVNGKPAVVIAAYKIKETDKSILFNCEGDIKWVPKSCVKILEKEKIMIQEWWYNQNF